MSVMTWTARRNPTIATGIAGALLGAVIGTAATWILVAAPGVPLPAAGAAVEAVMSNMGQYDVRNLGGTQAAGAEAEVVSNMGQYNINNMGGTRVK